MPKISEEMLNRVGLSLKDVKSIENFNVQEEIKALQPGTKFTVGETLFERITPERIAELKDKYGSSK